MQDDLNTPNAFVAVFDTVKRLNQALRVREIDWDVVGSLVYTVEKMLDVLGIVYTRINLSEDDRMMYQNWKQAVKEKDFETADKYRATLMERGIL